VDGESKTAHNAVLIGSPQTSEVHFLYGRDYQRCFYSVSRDAGLTFSHPTEITAVFDQYRTEYPWVMIATGSGHGIRLRSGRLLVPVWFSSTRNQKPTMVSIIYSDDNGNQWNRGPIIVRDGDGQGIDNPMEAVVVELQDGSVMMNVRNASPGQCRAVTSSPDGVNQWSPFRFDPQLREPFCMASIRRVAQQPPDSHNLMVWANPDCITTSGKPITDEFGNADRKNLTIRLSRDEGWIWSPTRVLEPDWSAYSDLAVGPDKTIYCHYECGCHNNQMWDVKSLCLARFRPEWVRG
jgi:sialidase-1